MWASNLYKTYAYSVYLNNLQSLPPKFFFLSLPLSPERNRKKSIVMDVFALNE